MIQHRKRLKSGNFNYKKINVSAKRKRKKNKEKTTKKRKRDSRISKRKYLKVKGNYWI